VDRKYMENFEMWCWRGLEKVSWIDRVRYEGERNITQTVKDGILRVTGMVTAGVGTVF
jgi:hypothetical protein